MVISQSDTKISIHLSLGWLAFLAQMLLSLSPFSICIIIIILISLNYTQFRSCDVCKATDQYTPYVIVMVIY